MAMKTPIPTRTQIQTQARIDEIAEKAHRVSAGRFMKASGKQVRAACLLPESDISKARKYIKKASLLYYLVEAFAIAIMCFSVFFFAKYELDTRGAQAGWENIAGEYIENAVPSGDSQADSAAKDESGLPPIVDFAGLQSQNPECWGWLMIPNTSVNYPIMGSDERDKYLHVDFDQNPSINGSIFFDYQNTEDLSQQHIVIYGHHMVNDVMFHDVSDYTDSDFFYSHRTLYLETPSCTYVLRAVGSYVVSGDEYETRQVLFDNADKFQSYLDTRLAKCGDNGIYTGEYDRSTMDKLVTLITCTNSGDNRVVVECTVDQEYPTGYVPNVIASAE